MKVVEIFSSIEGEGKRQGELSTFIRLHGCNLSCAWCDTRYAWDEGSFYTEMNFDKIFNKCEEFGNVNITVTGGEPLIHDGIDDFLKVFSKIGKYNINVETNGSIPIGKRYANIFYTIDCKMPSSGMTANMIPVKIGTSTIDGVRKSDAIKFVVADIQDLMFARTIIDTIFGPTIYIIPVYGTIGLDKIAQFMKDNKMQRIRLQAQLHKQIWPGVDCGV